MEGMTLGNTVEEKRETYELLTKKSKKWGKVFAVLGVLCALGISGLLLSGTESIFLVVIFAAVLVVAMPVCYFWYGQIVYYGYLAMKIFFVKRNIGVSEVAGAVGTSVLVSYVLGGKKATKKLGILWLIVLFIALTVGIFAGLYYYVKFRKEAKELGFISDVKIRFSKA